MKVKEAIAQGYQVKEVTYQRGYVSRRILEEEQEVLTAQGRRRGQLYFLRNCPWSTKYCLRAYLTKFEPVPGNLSKSLFASAYRGGLTHK